MNSKEVRRDKADTSVQKTLNGETLKNRDYLHTRCIFPLCTGIRPVNFYRLSKPGTKQKCQIHKL